MIEFYYHPSPNPAKIALFLEESGLEYTLKPVDTRKGEQFDPAFLKINPNAKTPAIVDTDTKAAVFDSSAILLYLAEKTGQFLPENEPATRAEALSWLMLVATGIGPYSGQSVHFTHFAPGENDYAINRYQFEARRHWQLIDDHLQGSDFMVGDSYSIVDMAVWGWAGPLPFVLNDENAWNAFPNAKRLVDWINARTAAERAGALKQQHAFKTEMDDDARRHMFPQNK